MTYNVFSGTLNPTHSLTHCDACEFFVLLCIKLHIMFYVLAM